MVELMFHIPFGSLYHSICQLLYFLAVFSSWVCFMVIQKIYVFSYATALVMSNMQDDTFC